jgi:hypothetical protein
MEIEISKWHRDRTFMTTIPKILETGKTPGQWVQTFSEFGIEISERSLKERARQIGAFCSLGKALLLKPEHIDRIFEETTCRSNSISVAENGGSEAAPMALTATSTEALEHLTRRSQKQSSGKLRGKRNNVRSLDQMRLRKQTS